MKEIIIIIIYLIFQLHIKHGKHIHMLIIVYNNKSGMYNRANL